jgi:SAM-dependent methyltransferase
MSFSVGADAYDRFMGRYSVPLAERFANFAGVATGGTALDVGCGPGALTRELVNRLGPDAVTAVDPSESFVAAATERLPGVAVLRAAAEHLPFADGRFDAALAQLVVHFMSDPQAGLGEMRRVTRPGGTVAACVWDHAGGHGPLSPLWDAARELDRSVKGESLLVGARHGHLAELFQSAGLHVIYDGVLEVEVQHPTFEEWWEPFTFGVGPAGSYVTALEPERQAQLRDRLRERLGESFLLPARVWAARGIA